MHEHASVESDNIDQYRNNNIALTSVIHDCIELDTLHVHAYHLK